ncbi:hypothetical protein BCY91_02775 [Pelobium manganitolerans]|uniref:Uncharacterized protein n=1 Tax=Pelobium manganitolerans TaxID=1842495 RepID=A0A419S777_9SPHI|nr:hypothetical protein [Pelobium manganitolerans]RKD17089.1 hypothetical protein BCY91_02775 [Pelobium manganitolerans]
MKIYRILVFFSAILILQACSSGKKSLQSGNYDQAVYTAINRLKSNPTKSKALETLKKGYDFALKRHLNRIADAKLSDDVFKWEQVLAEYRSINNLANAIGDCPACLALIPNPEKYIEEQNDAKYFAALARYNEGLRLLELKNRADARDAYYHFETADQLVPGFKDAKLKMDDAYWAAVIRVRVEPVQVNSRLYKLSNEYFQNKIDEYLKNYEAKSFVRFYSPAEARMAKVKFDQVLQLSFDDFLVGQTYVKERIEDIKKDNVKIGETRDSVRKAIYGTVTGKLTTFEKTITSTGLLDFRVIDLASNKVIRQDKLPGTYVWTDTWGAYRGDERALTENDKILLSRRESRPPSPQDLFLAFTKPIYDQLVQRIHSFYRAYN